MYTTLCTSRKILKLSFFLNQSEEKLKKEKKKIKSFLDEYVTLCTNFVAWNNVFVHFFFLSNYFYAGGRLCMDFCDGWFFLF